MASNTKENWLVQADVDAACVAITQRGERVEIPVVHREIGSRGNWNTIKKMVLDWQSRNVEQAVAAENLPLESDIPDSLREIGLNMMKAVYHQAKKLAQADVDAQRVELKKNAEFFTVQFNDVNVFSDNQAIEIEKLRGELESANNRIVELDGLTNQQSEQIKTVLLSEERLKLSLADSVESANKMSANVVRLQDLQISLTVERDLALAENVRLKFELDAVLVCKEKKSVAESALSLQVQSQQISLDVVSKQVQELKGERADALAAEKLALEKSAVLQGKMDFVLEDYKRLLADISGSVKSAPVKKALQG
jgi:hypothetical protein